MLLVPPFPPRAAAKHPPRALEAANVDDPDRYTRLAETHDGKGKHAASCRTRRLTGMNALKLLKQDHDEVKSMLSDLESTTERAVKTRTDGLASLKAELEVHEAIEEEIFYPALKEHPKTKDLALEGYEEHHVVDMVMAEIEDVAPSDETWMAKFTVMKENLEHHIEEEEGEMFEQAERVFDDDELDDLGERMQARKDELKAGSSA